jgi:malate dehydrogenase
MVETILLNQPRLLPIAAYLQGEYGLNDLFLGVPTRLGAGGVDRVLELRLSEAELAALTQSAQAVRANIDRAMILL